MNKKDDNIGVYQANDKAQKAAGDLSRFLFSLGQDKGRYAISDTLGNGSVIITTKNYADIGAIAGGNVINGDLEKLKSFLDGLYTNLDSLAKVNSEGKERTLLEAREKAAMKSILEACYEDILSTKPPEITIEGRVRNAAAGIDPKAGFSLN